MIAQRIIERKRDGEELPPEDLEAFLAAYLREDVSEYQMAAFLMAVYFRGMSGGELSTLVRQMIESGATLDLSFLTRPRIDKHSTGGVGDKVSLILAPLAAELGLAVPMMSGRGLGHSGGTLDKLEAIPGFRTMLPLPEFVTVLEANGCAMIGQTDEIAPLDRRIYALRSVTGTVGSIPLIAASIMSKKLAEDLDGLVLDVKVGRGAFLQTEAEVVELARTMVGIGRDHGVPTVALLTNMETPLGRTIGNALEVREAIECLGGGGPSDLRDVVRALAAEMAVLGGVASTLESGSEQAAAALDDGRAIERMARLIAAQGGDPAVVTDPGRLGHAPERVPVLAGQSGFVAGFEPVRLGNAVVELGGGRTRLGQSIDPLVGFELHAQAGDAVDAEQVLATVHAATPADAELGVRRVLEAVELVEEPPPAASVLLGRMGAEATGGYAAG